MKSFLSILSIALLSLLTFVSSLPMNKVNDFLLTPMSDADVASALSIPKIGRGIQINLPWETKFRPAIVVGHGAHTTFFALPLFKLNEDSKYKGRSTEASLLAPDSYTIFSNTVFHLGMFSIDPEEKVPDVPPNIMLEVLDFVERESIPIEEVDEKLYTQTDKDIVIHRDSIAAYRAAHKSSTLQASTAQHVSLSSTNNPVSEKFTGDVGQVTRIQFPGSGEYRLYLIVAKKSQTSIVYAIHIHNSHDRSAHDSNNIGQKDGTNTKLYTALHNLPTGNGVITKFDSFLYSFVSKSQPLIHTIPNDAMIDLLEEFRTKRLWFMHRYLEDGCNTASKYDFYASIDATLRAYNPSRPDFTSAGMVGRITSVIFPDGNKPRHCIIVAISELDPHVLYVIPLFRSNERGSTNFDMLDAGTLKLLHNKLQNLSIGDQPYSLLGKIVIRVSLDGSKPFEDRISMVAITGLIRQYMLHEYHIRDFPSVYRPLSAINDILIKDDLLDSMNYDHPQPGISRPIVSRVGEVTIRKVPNSQLFHYCVIVGMSQTNPLISYALPFYHANEAPEGTRPIVNSRWLDEGIKKLPPLRQPIAHGSMHTGTYVLAFHPDRNCQLRHRFPRNVMTNLLAHLINELSSYKVLSIDSKVLTKSDAAYQQFMKSMLAYNKPIVDIRNALGLHSTSNSLGGVPAGTTDHSHNLPPDGSTDMGKDRLVL